MNQAISPSRSLAYKGVSTKRLDIKASVIATTNACPKSCRGTRDDKFSTENPPAVVIAAAPMALPVVETALDTQTSGPASGSCSASSSSLVAICIA